MFWWTQWLNANQLSYTHLAFSHGVCEFVHVWVKKVHTGHNNVDANSVSLREIHRTIQQGHTVLVGVLCSLPYRVWISRLNLSSHMSNTLFSRFLLAYVYQFEKKIRITRRTSDRPPRTYHWYPHTHTHTHSNSTLVIQNSISSWPPTFPSKSLSLRIPSFPTKCKCVCTMYV